jgi:acetyl esterase/lipase
MLLSAAALSALPSPLWAQRIKRPTTTTVVETTTTTTVTGAPQPLVPPDAPIVPVNIPLWAGYPPGSGGDGPGGALQTDANGAVGNVVKPMLAIYRPAKPNGTAIIIAAGGGYKRIEIGPEAQPVALWLASHGFTACVLTYRLPGEGWVAGVFAPFQDAQRAIRLVRGTDIALGGNRHIKRVGLLGFSAGGHLMGMAAARPDASFYQDYDTFDTVTARVDFAGLIYPVITLRPPLDDTSTRRALIGEHPTADESAGWSVETYVDSQCPRLFMAHAADDTVAPAENTVILQAACKRARVASERVLFSDGGHAFGLGRPDTPTTQWPELFLKWVDG